MTKLKPNKAVAARFKVTASGKLMRHKQGRRHILSKKTSKRKRALAKAVALDKGQLKMYSRMLCIK